MNYNYVCTNRHCENWSILIVGDVYQKLIPSVPKGKCPKGTYGCIEENCPDTCFCENHCSWAKCALYEAPAECLISVNSEWTWHFTKGYWVAQSKNGMRYLQLLSRPLTIDVSLKRVILIKH